MTKDSFTAQNVSITLPTTSGSEKSSLCKSTSTMQNNSFTKKKSQRTSSISDDSTLLNHGDIGHTKLRRETSSSFEWPKHSASSLPSLNSSVRSRLGSGKIFLPVNEECTSLSIPPSGRHLLGGFSDGTLRLFDLTGRLWSADSPNKTLDDLFSCDSSENEEEFLESPKKVGRLKDHSPKKDMVVASKYHQNFGAVAAQIYARGVITSLLMDVACTEDGLFAFGGVLRGSTELVAIDLSRVEMYHDNEDRQSSTKQSNILDLIRVYRHSDAKLKGFGACKRLKNGRNKLEYRLFTGKGIKNMHIWSFIPPQNHIKEPRWQCLYDTPTNGNTIGFLHFRYDVNGLFQGITKSDDQKLRVWNLGYDQHKGKRKETISIIEQLAKKTIKEKCDGRPKRPPYVDVRDTESSIGVFGSYVLSGGDGMYNKIGVMFLDVKDIQSPFNHNELAFPSSLDEQQPGAIVSRRSGRQQRGDLKSIVNVAGLEMDGSHVLLELSDGSLVHYRQNGCEKSSSYMSYLRHPSPDVVKNRKVCLTRIGAEGLVVMALSSYDDNAGRGSIVLEKLSTSSCKNRPDSTGNECVYWGYHGTTYLTNSAPSPPVPQLSFPTPELKAVAKKPVSRDSSVRMNERVRESASTTKIQISKAKKRKRHSTESMETELKEKAKARSSTIVQKEVNTGKMKAPSISPGGSRHGRESHQSEAINVPQSPVKETSPREITPSKQSKRIQLSPEQVLRPLSPKTEGDINVDDGLATPKKKKTASCLNGATVSPEQIGSNLDKSPVQPLSFPIEQVEQKNSIVQYFSKTIKDTKKLPMDRMESNDGSKIGNGRSVETLTPSGISVNVNQQATIDHETSFSDQLIASKNIDLSLEFDSTSGPSYHKNETAFYIPPASQSLARIHEDERDSLQRNHLASFRKIRNTILFSCKNMSNNNFFGQKQSVESWFLEEMSLHKASIENMLCVHRMEADALAATQKVEAGGIPVPTVEVNFPYPNVFNEARKVLLGQS